MDLTPAIFGEDGITLKPGVAMHFAINILYDSGLDIVRVHVSDPLTENYADRAVTNGMVPAGDGVKLPIRSIYDLIPSAIEEIVVMNRLLGHTEIQLPDPLDLPF
jgi:hypothetical protein